MPIGMNTRSLNINQWAQLDGSAGLSFTDILMGVLQTLQSGQGMGGGAGQGAGGAGGGCGGGGAAGTGGPANTPAGYGGMGGMGGMGGPANTPAGYGGMGGMHAGMGGMGGMSSGYGMGDMSMPGHHGSMGMPGGGLPGYGGGTGGMMPGCGLGRPSYGTTMPMGYGGLDNGYGIGRDRVNLGMPHGPGHSMGAIHSMFDHSDPFTSIGYGRYENTPASWSRQGNTVTQQGTIRSHPELVQLATRQALEANKNLSGDALYKDVAKRLTGYNNGGNGVAGAFGLSEDEANKLGRNFNHRLHDISAGGQQFAQQLADNPAQAVAMYDNGTLGQVAAVGKAGDTWRIEGGHTLQENSLKSRPIGVTARGETLYENTVESSNGANNGHDKHKMVAYSTGGPMTVDVVDNNNEYALENVDRSIVNHVAGGGNVNSLPVFGNRPLMGGHGAGHQMGMGTGMSMNGYGSPLSLGGMGLGTGPGMGLGYGSPFSMGGLGGLNIPPLTLPQPTPTSCPRTGGPVCSCDGNVSAGNPVSIFHGNMMH